MARSRRADDHCVATTAWLDRLTIVSEHFAAVSEEKSREAGEQRAFTSAVRPEQTKHLTRFNSKGRCTQRLDLAEALAESING